MNRFAATLLVASVAAGLPAETIAAESTPLAKLEWLTGHWVGIGEGDPGRSATQRSIDCVLECKYLRVDGRSVYPKQEKNPKGETHVSMDMWSFDRARKKLVLRTFDNLGFVTTYVQEESASSDTTLVLVAEHLENVPTGWRARYTYTFAPPNEYHELFELASKDKEFKPYVTNRFLRVDPAK